MMSSTVPDSSESVEIPALSPVSSSFSGADFAALIVRHDRPLLRYVMSLIPRRDDAEEVLQQTAAVLWERSAEYDHGRPFMPWALRFAYFEVLNFRKGMARDRLVFRADVLEAVAETRESMETELDQRREALRRCLERLPSHDRDLLQRRYCDSATVAALADEAGKTAKALYRRLDRIRELLAECVQKRASGMSIPGGMNP